MRTANFRRQHDAALASVAEMQLLIDQMGPEPTYASAYPVTMALAKLTGVLRIHLAQEDQLLYPQLMASEHPEVASTAARFATEMGGISMLFHEYAARWRQADTIVAEPVRFRDATAALLLALARRIERENTVLYPLADREALQTSAPVAA